ncbi:hypothetical protein [Streptomyces sp. NPDC003710]
MGGRRHQRVILLPGLHQCLLVGRSGYTGVAVDAVGEHHESGRGPIGQSGIGRGGGEVFAGPLRVFEEWAQVEQQPAFA